MWYPVRSLHALSTPGRISLALALLVVVAGPPTVHAQTVDYSRAERFLTWKTERLIAGAAGAPNWMETGDADRFWYRNGSHRVHILL